MKGEGPILLKLLDRVLYTLEALETYIEERQRRLTAEHKAKVQESWRRELAESRRAQVGRPPKMKKEVELSGRASLFEET
jgi:hypothetical protein